MKILNLRQSAEWAEFQASLGWKIVELSNGTKVAFLKSYLGNLCKIQRPQKMAKADLEELMSLAKEKKAIFIKIEPGIDQDENLLLDLGFAPTNYPLCPPSTLVIDLKKSKDSLWQDVSRSGKYSVNRSKREGDYVEFSVNPKTKELKEFYTVEKATGKRGKFYVQPFSHVLTMRDVFKDNAILARVYNKSGELLGAKFFFAQNGIATFLLGGTTALGREKSKGGYLLMWESILQLKKLGYKNLDLEGVDDDRFPTFTRNWGGFSHFKEKFGGKIVRYPGPYLLVQSTLLKLMSKLVPLPF